MSECLRAFLMFDLLLNWAEPYDPSRVIMISQASIMRA